MVNQHKRKQTAQQLQMEQRRKEVIVLAAQGLTETEIAHKLGVDNTTISKDIKALKLISQQFIYDVTKSDFTFYYRQCLELVKFVLRKQLEIATMDGSIEETHMRRMKLLSDILSTVSTLNEYYKVAPTMHRSPALEVLNADQFGLRPGSRVHKMTPEEENELLEQMRQDDEAEAKELMEMEKDNLKELSELEKTNNQFYNPGGVEEFKRLKSMGKL
jgi:transposase